MSKIIKKMSEKIYTFIDVYYTIIITYDFDKVKPLIIILWLI